MKYLLTISILISSFFAFSQQKGATPSSDVPLDSARGTSETYAVVVGISDYQDEGIPDLRFADKDAEAFAGFLQSPAGGSLDEDHLKVLINEQATMAQFAIALDWLWEVVKEDDRVIIYFSGHGDVERKSLTQPGFLLCWDAPARVYLAGGTLALPMFQEVISTLSVQNKAKVIVITDACRSGKLSGSKVGGAQLTSNNLAKQYANEIKILSCQPDEYSIEGEQWGGGRGAFSYHLLDGLSGMADGNDDNAVNLREIRNYLEENVTEEVSPQRQNPMVIGDKTEKLTDVFPEILAQIKEGKKGQMQLFTSTESRGIEEEVLAAADSSIVEMYFAFQKAIENKQFLEPDPDNYRECADFYYQKLSQEPQLEKLHSSMRRNYAAALQDEAQQFLNTMLNTGFTDHLLRSVRERDIVKKYPSYLERSAELLGEHHYMYDILEARKYYFMGKLGKKRKERREAYHQALSLQPDMPHAFTSLIYNYPAEQSDSAFYYFEKATKAVPGWVEPYIQLGWYYQYRLKDIDKAEETLDRAEQVDSGSVRLWYTKAKFYNRVGKYGFAEKWYLKIINGITSDVCFPCVHNDLGGLYKDKLNEYEKAEEQFKKAIELDSTFLFAHFGLGNVFAGMNRYRAAAQSYKKAIQIDSTFVYAYLALGNVYKTTRQYEEAEKSYKKAIQLDSTLYQVYNSMGLMFLYNNRIEEAEELFLKGLEIDDPHNIWGAYNLACLFSLQKQVEEALSWLEKALELKKISYQHIERDTDLDYIRNMEPFTSSMKKHFPDQQKSSDE